MSRTGFAHLPLHGGKAPRWLFERMVPLSREIVHFLAADQGERRRSCGTLHAAAAIRRQRSAALSNQAVRRQRHCCL
jgi:hypothetical protein